MKKKKLGMTLASLVLVGLIGIGATLAYFTDQDSATNVITMGHVDIELTEPNFEGGIDGGEIKDVTPNQTIVKDPTITVKADSESAYLRAKVEFDGLTDEQIEQLLPNISFRDEWKLSTDGYYYFQYAVGKAEVDQKFVLFDTVKIPETWGNEVANTSFDIIVTAEAIQADNFKPTRDDNGVITEWTYEDGKPITAETYKAK